LRYQNIVPIVLSIAEGQLRVPAEVGSCPFSSDEAEEKQEKRMQQERLVAISLLEHTEMNEGKTRVLLWASPEMVGSRIDINMILQ